jgi:ribonuclease HI
VRKKGKGRGAGRQARGQAWGSAPDVHRVYFDGACGPVNPGGIATFGWRFVGPDGQLLASEQGEVCRGPGATNNVAEWHALWRALQFLAARGWQGQLRIYGDSRLVINQLTGRWRCHKGHLRRYRDACLNLLRRMDWRASWIPREQNEEADELSKQARPEGASGPGGLLPAPRRIQRAESLPRGGSQSQTPAPGRGDKPEGPRKPHGHC